MRERHYRERHYRSPIDGDLGSHVKKNCPVCDQPFQARGPSMPRYCSKQCCKKAARRRQVEQRIEARAARDHYRVCARCGSSFEAQRATRQFCSTRCRVAAHRVSTLPR